MCTLCFSCCYNKGKGLHNKKRHVHSISFHFFLLRPYDLEEDSTLDSRRLSCVGVCCWLHCWHTAAQQRRPLPPAALPLGPLGLLMLVSGVWLGCVLWRGCA